MGKSVKSQKNFARCTSLHNIDSPQNSLYESYNVQWLGSRYIHVGTSN